MTTVSAVDLNLIGPLEALLRERHVSRAAEDLSMSQPAMSRALRSLRELFGDELLVRGPGGYRLTPRAERLQRELAQALPQLESLFSEESYDPRLAAHTFALTGTDYLLNVLGPALMARVLTESPGSTLHFGGWGEHVFRDVERGALDLALAGPYAPPPLRTEFLFYDGYVCVMSATHPLAGHGAITLEDYAGYRHAIVDIVGGRQGAVDRQLDALGSPRRAGVIVPFHGLAVSAITQTTLIATVPERTVADMRLDDSFAVCPAPPEIDGMSFVMTWHPRLDQDPAQSWLRDVVRRTAAALAPISPSVVA